MLYGGARRNNIAVKGLVALSNKASVVREKRNGFLFICLEILMN